MSMKLLPVLGTIAPGQPLPRLPGDEPVSESDLFALYLALEAERADVEVDQIAKSGCCSDGIVEQAEDIREMLADIRQKLHADADELGMSPVELDAAFSDLVVGMLGARGSEH